MLNERERQLIGCALKSKCNNLELELMISNDSVKELLLTEMTALLAKMDEPLEAEKVVSEVVDIESIGMTKHDFRIASKHTKGLLDALHGITTKG